MTQYTRPSNVPAWAESGATVQPTDPEIQAGWPATSVPPSRQRFNWILNWLANAVRYFLQLGVPEWASAETYIAGARVQHGGVTYKALASSTNVTPGTDAAKWEKWGFLDSEIQPRVDKLLTKSVAGGADVTLSAAEAENGILVLTGTITANINVVIPNAARRYVVHNGTSGSFALSLKTASGSPVVIPQSATKSVVVYCDGANTIRLAGSANDAAIQAVGFTATAGQTSFSVAYTPGSVFMVTRNGSSVGFTASSGSAVDITVAAGLGDVVNVYIASGFNVSNAVSKGGDTMTGSLTLSGNASAPLHAVPKQQLDAAIAGIATPIASTAEAQAQTDNTKAISPLRLAEALKGANQSLTANGYQKLPGGLIMQWGTGAGLTGNDGVSVTFPITFPNAALIASVNGVVAADADGPTICYRSLTTGGMRINNGTTEPAASVAYVVIGY